MTLLPQRRLGASGPTVTRMGLGMAALGRPGYINLGHRADLEGHRDPTGLRDRAAEVLDAAYAAGIRYVDCARSYGRAEEFTAHWLATRDVPDMVVGSKWGYTYVADWRDDVDVHEVKEHSPANLERQLALTRGVLGSRLALYQIHSATRESGVLADAAVLERLRALRAEGVAVGLSTSGPAQADTIRDAVATGVFDTVQSTLNPLEPSAGDALAEAHAAGMGVIVKEAVANGRLTARGGHAAFTAAAAQFGATPDAAAIAWALAQPFVDCVLSGASTVAQLADNLRAFAVEMPPDAFDGFREAPETYWSRRSGLRWN
ncbi:MAG: aldo/keto reductase [Thermoleophilia bacterium]